jgi:predicted DNA-binding transcriptional regulator AlpA
MLGVVRRSVQEGNTVTPPHQLDHLHKINEVARILSMGKRTLERMIAAGEFPQADFRCRRIARWRSSTVQAWIDARASRRDSNPEPRRQATPSRTGRRQRRAS